MNSVQVNPRNIKTVRDRAAMYLSHDVASVAGMTLPQMQQFVIGNFHLPPDKLEKLARRMSIREEEKKKP